VVYLFHCRVGVSLRAGCIYFIGGWVFYWRVGILLEGGCFIEGWMNLFHCRMGIQPVQLYLYIILDSYPRDLIHQTGQFSMLDSCPK